MGPTREDHTTLDIYTISDGKVIRLTNKNNRLDKIGFKTNRMETNTMVHYLF